MLSREGTLGTLGFTAQFLQCTLVVRCVEARLALKHLEKVLHDALIKILTTKMSVSIGCHHFKHTRVDGKNRHIKSTAAKIVDEDVLFIVCLVEAIRNCSGSWFVQDTHHSEAGNGTSILGGLALCIVKVGRHCNHSVSHWMTQICLGDFLHAGKNHGRNFLCCVHLFLALDIDLDAWVASFVDNLVRQQLKIALHSVVSVTSSNQPLHIKNRVFWVDGTLIFGCLANQALCVGKCDHTRCDTVTERVGDDFDSTLSPNTNA
mmetsp:Transcript_13801/g.20816  ORF Transcript_13801/g.20816 Transcript_13801/m.20816 type:complete len:262 (+) Transcript_13801:1126-1911(+)